jgi:uncharacterized protein with FMN-binding domain
MRRAVPAVIATVVGLLALLSFKSSPSTSAKSASAQTVAPTSPAATAPPASASGTTPTTGSSTTRTIDGDPFDNRYGTVQVRVTLQGNQITGITALQMPSDRQRSAEISQQAEPLLQQEALQAQSAQIDTVSGATFTSQSYAQSLQSALDKR